MVLKMELRDKNGSDSGADSTQHAGSYRNGGAPAEAVLLLVEVVEIIWLWTEVA